MSKTANKNIRVIIIEDNLGDARLAAEYLKEKDFQDENIFYAENMEEAKRKIREINFDVILLDLDLPDSKREETVNSLFDVVENIPVIILSGTHDEVSALDSFKMGVQEFLVKNDISSNALSRCINNAILRNEKEKEVKELNKFKDNLLSILSHDLRSPFNALIGYIDFTMEEIENLSTDEILENLSDIKGISFTVLEFIENLLAWSRMQNNKIKVEPETFTLAELITKSQKVLKVIASAKNIDLQFSGFDDTKVKVDVDMMDTVIRNLVSNAIKFSPEGSEINVTAEMNEDVLIKVKDEGIGIPPEDIKNIFELSAGSVRPGTRNEKGHGLGLQICKDFVERNGGEIRIESIINKGTTVIFTIPAAE